MFYSFFYFFFFCSLIFLNSLFSFLTLVNISVSFFIFLLFLFFQKFISCSFSPFQFSFFNALFDFVFFGFVKIIYFYWVFSLDQYIITYFLVFWGFFTNQFHLFLSLYVLNMTWHEVLRSNPRRSVEQ